MRAATRTVVFYPFIFESSERYSFCMANRQYVYNRVDYLPTQHRSAYGLAFRMYLCKYHLDLSVSEMAHRAPYAVIRKHVSRSACCWPPSHKHTTHSSPCDSANIVRSTARCSWGEVPTSRRSISTPPSTPSR